MRLNRRGFLAGVASTLAAARVGAAEGHRPRIAAITTVFHKYSHSEHIFDRFLEGYGWEGRHHRPEMDIVSMYVEQVGKNDLSRERVSRHPEVKIYPTIAEALTQGGNSLAVDAVVIVGEHGRYPRNEKRQILYPRYEYFQQVVDVYRKSGKTAPVFSDKHLSWSWDHALEMVKLSKEMGFGFMAGSSLPITWRQPSIDLPLGADVKEAVAIWNGGIDGGDIHVIEAMQSIVERRKGGETGVKSVQAIRGDAFWKALESGSWDKGGWDPRLLEACLSRSNQLHSARSTYGHVYPTTADLRRMAPNSYAYRFEYADGLKASVVQFQGGREGNRSGGVGKGNASGGVGKGNASGGVEKGKASGVVGGSNAYAVVGDCSVAARLGDNSVFSLMFYLPYYSMRNFFSPQVHHIETLIKTGKPPYPIERTLLTTGMTAIGVESLYQGQKRLETPHLGISYQPTRESTFRRS